jgi:hypothetical protein
VRFEQIENARYSRKHGDALAGDQLQQARCLKAIFKMKLGGKQRRNPQTHKLSENMAQWKSVKEAQLMEDSLHGEIFLHLALDRFKA